MYEMWITCAISNHQLRRSRTSTVLDAWAEWDCGAPASCYWKTTTNRFNTITNTKRRGVEVTGDSSLKEDLLPENHRLFVTSLRELSNIEQFTLPPLAPIASTLRNIISGDAKLVKMAKEAAMKVCETSCVWFDPKLAVQSFLLD
ncbi:hypothetical protein ADEAN_000972800 [Angomonas deanei]|uniref:Uncharacterized protein n=1 Tax=Angomonas deanei TaxID=59799 RepID=A0A7G2CQU6_9TRYP|nr:hypothetical protein ADEAN_000972800 [Angomonas deanei]